MVAGRVAVLLTVLLLASCCGVARAAEDPAAAGPLAVERAEYDVGQMAVHGEDASATIPQDLRGDVHVPRGSGPFPVLVFLHGYHMGCEDGGDIDAGCRQTRNWEGYDVLARALASHGYAVLSLSANQINDHQGDVDPSAFARVQLLERTLELLRDWDAGSGPGPLSALLHGRLDLSRIGLMGHSRGGEAIAQFVVDGLARRWPVRALAAVAPIDNLSAAPVGVPYGVLLPYCDGDVLNSEGAAVLERVRRENARLGLPSVQWGIEGANHNWFNARWAQDADDAGQTTPAADTTCMPDAPRRLTKEEQLRVGNVLVAAWLRTLVGGEDGFADVLTGAATPPALCPDREREDLRCGRVVHTSWLAPAADTRLLLGPRIEAGGGTPAAEPGVTLTTSGSVVTTGCEPAPASGVLLQADCAVNDRQSTPQLALRWTGGGSVDLALGDLDVRRFGTLTFRGSAIHEDPLNAAGDPDLELVLVDTAGHERAVRASTVSTSLTVLPGTTSRDVLLGGVRVPLSAFTGVDLAHVARASLRTATPTGAVLVADLAFQEPAQPPAAPAAVTVAARQRIRRGTLARRGLPVVVRCARACDVRVGLGRPGTRQRLVLGPGSSARLRLRTRARAGRVLRLRVTGAPARRVHVRP